MSQFIAGPEYTGAPFELFGVPHLIAIGIIALLVLGLILIGRRLPLRWRLAIRYGLAGVLLVDEAIWHWWNWTTGQWALQTTLPLHLCSVLVFLSALMLVTRSASLYELVYFLGIAGATQAILTPDAGIYGFPHLRFFQVFISHGSIVLAAVYMTTVEGFRPTLVSVRRVLIKGNIYMAAVGVINALLGSNYLYIAHKPETASLLDVLPAWPWYIPILEITALVMIALLYLPFAIADLRARQTAQQAAA